MKNFMGDLYYIMSPISVITLLIYLAIGIVFIYSGKKYKLPEKSNYNILDKESFMKYNKNMRIIIGIVIIIVGVINYIMPALYNFNIYIPKTYFEFSIILLLVYFISKIDKCIDNSQNYKWITSMIAVILILNLGYQLSENLNDISFKLSDISNSINSLSIVHNDDSDYNSNNDTPEKFDMAFASSYLNVEYDELVKLVEDKNSNIPFIRIGDDYIFYKDALDNWLKVAKVEID